MVSISDTSSNSGTRIVADGLLLQTILDTSDDAIFGQDLDGIVTTWNKAAERTFGYAAAEMIGKSCGLLVMEDHDEPGHDEEVSALQKRVRQGEGVERCEAVRRHRDGQAVHVLLTLAPIHDKNGTLVGALHIARDVTGIRQAALDLREGDARLRAIFESIPDGLVLIDEHGIIQSFSPVAERLFGYAAAEVLGQNVRMLMPSPNREAHDGYLRHYRDTGERRIIGIGRTVIGLRKDGTTFPMELAVGEVKGAGPPSFTGFVRDLTERQETELRLREALAELAHASRLTAMGQMAAMLAHEINQPLTAITNYMKAGTRLLAVPGPLRREKLDEAMERSAEQALRAGQIIRRLREFVSRGESEKRIEAVPAIVMEARALALGGAHHQGAKVLLSLDTTPAQVLVDKIQIQQVLLNLIRNGLEAMESNIHPELRIRTLVTDGYVEVSVSDQGPGLTPEVADQLFQPFVTTKKSGMGIGLSICRSIVEAHGGRLWYEPNPQGGAVFSFTLILVPEDQAE